MVSDIINIIRIPVCGIEVTSYEDIIVFVCCNAEHQVIKLNQVVLNIIKLK